MNDAIHPALFIFLTLLLFLPSLWARFLLDFEKTLLIKLFIFLAYNLTIMFALRSVIIEGYIPLIGISDNDTVKSWSSFMVVAHAFTFILPEKANRWFLKNNEPTMLFVDTAPKITVKNTRRKRISAIALNIKVLFFSVFYTLKLTIMILYFAPLEPLPSLITIVILLPLVTASFYTSSDKKFTPYF